MRLRAEAQDFATAEGAVRLALAPPVPLTWVAAYPGAEAALAAAFPAPGWPGPGETRADAARRTLWMGPATALVLGERPELPGALAAVVAADDGWTGIALEGAGHREVLARLTPVDLREAAFPEGATARTLLGHVAVSLTRTGAAAWLVLAPLSMGRTVWDDLAQASRDVGARAALAAGPAQRHASE